MNSAQVKLRVVVLVPLLFLGTASAMQQSGQSATQPPQESQPPPPASQATPGQPMVTLASSLVGLEITDSAGAALAKVVDAVVAPSGEVALLAERGTGGVAAIPLDMLQLRLPEEPAPAQPDAVGPEPDAAPPIQALILKADDKRLASAPTLDKHDLDSLDEAWLAQSRQHWKESREAQPPAGAPAADGNLHPDGRPFSDALPGVRERTQGDSADQPGAAGAADAAKSAPSRTPAFRAKALVGKDVKGPVGESLGEIKDIVVNLPEAKVAYVVIEVGGLLGVGGVHHGVPLDALKFGAPDEGLVLEVDRKAFESQPGIDLEHLPVAPSFSGSLAAGG